MAFMRINTKIKDRGKILPEKLEAILWSKNIKAIDPDEDKVKENLCKTCFSVC